MIKKINKAFTLIELLVVISIIGILTTLVFANLNTARQRARDVQRKSDLRNIQMAIKLYYNDKASYPSTIPFGGEWKLGTIIYMSLVPNDPQYDQATGIPKYLYTYDLFNDTYTLDACLENVADSKCSTATGTRCASSGTCLYSLIP